MFLAEGAEYQLITWSKDRTLRFWPVDSDTMEASISSHFFKFTVLTGLRTRKRDIRSDPPKYLPNHTSLPSLGDHTNLSDMRQKDQTQTQLYPPRSVREAY